mgnify:CR=1 FL=1
MISKTEKVRFSTRMVQVSRGSSMKIGQLPTANTNALTVRLRCLMSLRDDGWPIAHTLSNYDVKITLERIMSRSACQDDIILH